MISREYFQTEEFTCGPAALLTGMGALNPQTILSREEEYLIWHESNAIFMGDNGHLECSNPGCSIYGLALSAMKRGFSAKVTLNLQGDSVLFLDWVTKGLRRDIHIWNEQRFRQLFLIANGEEDFVSINYPYMKSILEKKGIIISLISDDPHDQNAGHWVTIEMMNREKTVYFDPYLNNSLNFGRCVVSTDDFINNTMCYSTKRKKACLYIENHK